MYTTIVLAKMNTIKASCELPSLDWQIVWQIHVLYMKIGLLVREGVCVCVSGNACGYFISHPWEELHLYVMGFICVHVL